MESVSAAPNLKRIQSSSAHRTLDRTLDRLNIPKGNWFQLLQGQVKIDLKYQGSYARACAG